MHFELASSPLRNFFKYDSENIFELLLPFARNFMSTQHEVADTPLPPGAFFIEGERCTYLNGYSFTSPELFAQEIDLLAKTATAVISIAELGSLEKDFSQGLVMICAQTTAYYRCRVFSLASGKSFEILENPLRIELPVGELESYTNDTCHLVGVEFLLRPHFIPCL